jgi:hypothetical protein
MQKTYKSLQGQMIYVILSGASLIFMPNVLLNLLGLEPTNEIWIRVLGLLVFILAFYYNALSRHGNRQTIMATVHGRIVFCTGLTLMIVFGLTKPILLLFVFAESLLAIWTWQEVKRA